MEKIFSWTFSTDKKRGQLWYITAGAIVIGFVLWGIISSLYIMSFVIILVTGLYIYVENNSEDEVEVIITSLGIKVDNNFYDYSKIRNFAVVYNRDQAQFLRLNLNIKGIKTLELKLDNSIAGEVTDIMHNYAEEDEKAEYTMMDKLIRLLKL
ncbi:MAG: hypothetical protein N4A38_04090 [Candidatus Gracilibacteria bacterium]|nr:hypothetical protein [Candidatus Gracilibacteria bacterium]